MLVDYLRYIAFNGELSSFFEFRFRDYVGEARVTGLHISYMPGSDLLNIIPEYLQEELIYRSRIQAEFSSNQLRHTVLDLLRERVFDIYKNRYGVPETTGVKYHTNLYSRVAFDFREQLQILIDIHPDDWRGMFEEPRSYEGVPIKFRRVGPAMPHFDGLPRLHSVPSAKSGFGTLCGYLSDGREMNFALTCQHVLGDSNDVWVSKRRRFLGLTSRREMKFFGNVYGGHDNYGDMYSHHSDASSMDISIINLSDEAKQSLRENKFKVIDRKPIQNLVQESEVYFSGCGSGGVRRARIAAVSVRKSIDINRDGNLIDVGDVLMLGSPAYNYVIRKVSRPGDSGSAVFSAPLDSVAVDRLEHSEWVAMIIAGDDVGTYAYYSESAVDWILARTGWRECDFLVGDWF